LQNFNEEERAVDHKKTVLAIDESPSLFKSAEHPSEMFRKFRSKEICIAVGLQEKASIEKDGKAGLLDTLVNNATTYFISRLSDEATIKTISSIYGTEKNVESTIRSVIGENQETTSSGDSSLRVGEKFI
jgi:type IV secretory pathway TraG/TraD family ATPase VirD4